MLRTFVGALLVCGAVAVAGSTPAAAMPVGDLQTKAAGAVENVAWVCRRDRCWQAPGYYHSYGYAPGVRFHIGPRGHHRHW